MTESPDPGPGRREPPDDAQSAPDLGRSLGEVVGAALDVGVSMSRVLAQATAANGKVKPLPPATPPLQAIVRYGITAMGNMVSAIASGGQVLRQAAGATAAAAQAAAQSVASPPAAGSAAAPVGTPASPRVHAGATLRVPLTVENTSERPMRELQPSVRALRHGGAAGADATGVIPVAAVHFAPERFDVAPRDFEKLTVFVAVPEGTPVGSYELILALGPEEPDLRIGFGVVAADG